MDHIFLPDIVNKHTETVKRVYNSAVINRQYLARFLMLCWPATGSGPWNHWKPWITPIPIQGLDILEFWLAAFIRLCLWPLFSAFPADLSLRPRLPYLLILHNPWHCCWLQLPTDPCSLCSSVHLPSHWLRRCFSWGELLLPISLSACIAQQLPMDPFLWCKASCSFKLIFLHQSLFMDIGVTYLDLYDSKAGTHG